MIRLITSRGLPNIQSSITPLAGAVLSRSVSYVQGQSPSPRVREYFYFIDHQGQLFLDDTKIKNFVTCFKDKMFLKFFFRRIKLNSTGRFEEEFPYVSPCGMEKNYIRCDDVPFVYTTLIDLASEENSAGSLTCNGIGEDLTVPFEPTKVCMLPESGRIYHPAPEKTGGVGLIKSSLAIELSPHFGYGSESQDVDPPTHFNWMGKNYELDNSLWDLMRNEEAKRLKKEVKAPSSA